MIARWHIQAKFGQKQTVIDVIKEWNRSISEWTKVPLDRFRILSCSLGGSESAIEVELEVKDLAELNDVFERIGSNPEHPGFSKRLEPHMVSGSTYWTVYRVVT